MENYFTSQNITLFNNCDLLVYVFDVESNENEKDLNYFLKW